MSMDSGPESEFEFNDLGKNEEGKSCIRYFIVTKTPFL